MSRGGSFPSLVQTSSGRQFVMKLSGVGQGTSGLFTEFIAMRLAAVLEPQSATRSSDHAEHALPWQVGTDEFYEALQRSAGWNLGVEFIDFCTRSQTQMTSRNSQAHSLTD